MSRLLHARSLTVLVLCWLLIGCVRPEEPVVPTEADLAETKAAIGAQARAFSAAYMRGDVDAMMEMYTEDGVIFPGNRDYIRGRADLRPYWTPRPGRVITHHELTAVEVEIVGDTAYDFGYYQVSGENDGEAWGPAYGKYVVVWKRGADGVWRMHLDMWNSRPAPASEDTAGA